ncbi:hypothetical protein CV102_22480 [Natronococcus pandeyae]|uniref:Winged helix-turn-helix transcriptional regulator n=1 Tax=Natronococcus pandeyae TaxID=2055836 RepID=A0A8J8TN85_9EURY|nr:winged helix-turn-helix domain-containing protein [Natronococcus pandeyae]TYL36396.1 hypothetical protein CV102_22480 [Natronococcus pandeyae]
MSESGGTIADGRIEQETTVPRAVLHKKILDAAAERPDASMEELAEDISFATTDLVERVLDEYGDPGAKEEDDGDEKTSEPMEEEDESDDEAASTTIPGEIPAETTDLSTEQTDETAMTTDSSTSGETEMTATEGTTESDFAATQSTENSDEPDAEIDSDSEKAMNAHEITNGLDTQTNESQPDQGQLLVEVSDLTEKQRETLRAIQNRPTATQAELADELGVTSATINQRVNSIDGFDWSNRQTFVDHVFDQLSDSSEDSAEKEVNVADKANKFTDNTATSDAMEDTNPTDINETVGVEVDDESDSPQCTDLSAQVNELTDRIEALEQSLDRDPTSTSTLGDTELAHKVIHACFKSDQITEDEELQLLEDVVNS